MRYLINNKAIYDTEEKIIFSIIDVHSTFQMNTTMCWLLDAFIENNNQLMTREVLLKSVWDDNGLTASGSNLNNTISLLRKILSNVGLDDIIVTVKKKGFYLSAHLIQKKSETETETETEENKSKIKRQGFKYIVSISITFIICLSYILLHGEKHIFDNKNNHFIQVGEIEECNIFLLNKDLGFKYSKERIEYFMKKNNVTCKERSDVFFYFQNARFTSDSLNNSTFFISLCPKDEKQNCENFYENNDL